MLEIGTPVRIVPTKRYHIGYNCKLIDMGTEILIDPNKGHTLDGPWIVQYHSTKRNGRYMLKWRDSKYTVSIPDTWVEEIHGIR